MGKNPSSSAWNSSQSGVVFLEGLEDRIAPASFTYTDVDGDMVKIMTSKGTDSQLQAAAQPNIVAGQLEKLNFADNATFAGTSISIKVISRGVTGNGLADVGFIDASNIDLGAVTVGGDIGKIVAGHGSSMGLKSLTAQSIGAHGLTTQGGTGDLDWLIEGGSNDISVAGNVDGAHLLWATEGKLKVHSISIGGNLTGLNSAADGDGSIELSTPTNEGSLGKLFIGGSLIGDATHAKTGYVEVSKVGSVTIGGSLIGTAMDHTGNLSLDRPLPSAKTSQVGQITVGGSLIGADGNFSGAIYASFGVTKTVTIGGDLKGGDGDNSGGIFSNEGQSSSTVGGVKIGGSMIGGDGDFSGGVETNIVGSVTVGGSVLGGGGHTSGAIIGSSHLGVVRIGSNVTGGAGDFSAAILSVSNIESVTIGGSLTGGGGIESGSVKFLHLNRIDISGNLTGGGGDQSGEIQGTNLWMVNIGRNLAGGTGIDSGAIIGTSSTNISIGGSLTGGGATSSGVVEVDTLKNLTIGGNLTGGTSHDSGFVSGVTASGKIFIGGDVRGSAVGTDASSFTGYIGYQNASDIEIGGSLIGGDNSTVVAIQNSGAVMATGTLQTLTIHGNIVAGSSTGIDKNLGAVRAGVLGTMQVDGSIIGNANHSVMITAAGDTAATNSKDLAINKLTVDGGVSFTNIVGGYDTNGTTSNGDGAVSNGGNAQLGTITIQNGFADSSIATAINNQGFAWADVGDNNTLLPIIGTADGSIAKLVINGDITASVANGIVARQIHAFELNGFSLGVGREPVHQALTANALLQLQTIPVI